ncbi:MAG: hypothetical protein Q8O88_03695 [bacterium]|nr:hypothetical protein [bacterium]
MKEIKHPTKTKPKTERTFDFMIEVDGKGFGLNTTFNPDAGTDKGDLDIFDTETGEFLDEMCQASFPEELNRIKEYIRENLIF